MEVGNGSVTISTQEYVQLIDKSRKLFNLEANYKDHLDKVAKNKIQELGKALYDSNEKHYKAATNSTGH